MEVSRDVTSGTRIVGLWLVGLSQVNVPEKNTNPKSLHRKKM